MVENFFFKSHHYCQSFFLQAIHYASSGLVFPRPASIRLTDQTNLFFLLSILSSALLSSVPLLSQDVYSHIDIDDQYFDVWLLCSVLKSVAGCLLSGQSALERPESIDVFAAARRHIILGLVMPVIIIPRVRRIGSVGWREKIIAIKVGVLLGGGPLDKSKQAITC